ncbi:SAM-dependent methyltransferase [Streptomyces capparidis]
MADDEFDFGTDLEVHKPHPARIYDYWLGGKDNYAPDREAAEHAIKVSPDIPAAARENRAFLRRAVTMCAAEGIRQFVDIGAGLPTQGNVHEIAQGAAPGSRVVYVDNDPIVLAHGRALLAENRTTTVITADMREPEKLLAHPELLDFVDYREPVAVLLVAVLHFLDDEHAARAVAAVRDRIAPGSFLVLSHSTHEGYPEKADEIIKTWKNTNSGITARGRAAVREFFDGFELLEPGVVHVPEWRPEQPLGDYTRWMYAGVGRKPGR